MSRHVEFSIERLPWVDNGKTATVFNQLFAKAVQDCKARCGNSAKRTVTLVANITPADDGFSVDVAFDIKTSIPPQQSGLVRMASRSVRGDVTFHPDLPDDPDGNTLFDQAPLDDAPPNGQ